MKKVKSFCLSNEMLNLLDERIKDVNIKRSAAIENLMRDFNNRFANEGNALKELALSKVPKSESRLTTVAINIEEKEFENFFKNTERMKKGDAVNALIFNAMQLDENKLFDLMYGG